MADYNRYRGSSDYPFYGSREEDRGRYSRREYDQSEGDYGNMGQSGQRRGSGMYGSEGEEDRRWRRYDEDYNREYGNRGSREYGGSGYGAGQYFSGFNPERYRTGRGGIYGYSSEYNPYRSSSREYDEDYENPGNMGRSYERHSMGRGREYGGEQREQDRGWWDRTRDEVQSWFGDEEAERRRRQDKRMGMFRGKGPKGYHRSDERIREDVNDRLSDDPFLDASEIEVQVNNGEVILTGTVDNRIDKRRAEDIAEDVSGVTNVQNQLRVKQTATATMGQTQPMNQ
jgi:osmotically-inducible protein OsmY